MDGLSIFLVILIAVLTVTIVTVLILVVSLLRRISRTQSNIHELQKKAVGVGDAVSIITTIIGVLDSAWSKVNSSERKSQHDGSKNEEQKESEK